MKYLIALLLILITAVTASAMTDIVGLMGHSNGFSGRFPIVGGIGPGTVAPSNCGVGAIDASAGCPLPMLGM